MWRAALFWALLPGFVEGVEFVDPQPVDIVGYDGDAMEPFVSRDGRYLLFNNRPEAPNTNLYVAQFASPTRLVFLGELAGANGAALDAVASLDRSGTLYFISTRSYAQTLSTVYRARFRDGGIDGVELVEGVSRLVPGQLNFDIDISLDGQWLYFVDSAITPAGPVTADLALARRRGHAFQRVPSGEMLLSAINTDALEYAPAISADGLLLLYTRWSREPLSVSIYAATRKHRDQPFSPGQRQTQLEGFVEAASFAPDESAIYFHRLDQDRFRIHRARRVD
jgi:hypothetical protein